MNWVDYAIIGFIALSVISGLRKGFILSVSNIACIIAAIYIAKSYYKDVALFLISKTALEDKTLKFLQEKNPMSGFLHGMTKGNPIFSYSDSFASDFNSFASVLIINAIAVICIFLAARITLAVAESYLTGLSALPGLRDLNRLGGAALGLAKSVIILLLIFAVITPVSALQVMEPVSNGIKASMLAQYFYTYNFILGWIWATALDIIK